jgi:hypothetical protein
MYILQVTTDMVAMGQQEELMIVSNTLAMSFEQDAGLSCKGSCQKRLVTSNAYRVRIRYMLLSKLSLDIKKTVSQRTSTAVLNTALNLLTEPEELTTDSMFLAGNLLVSSLQSMLARNLREDNYLFRVFSACDGLAGATLAIGDKKTVQQIMTMTCKIVLHATQQYMDTMLMSEGPFNFSGSNLDARLQRVQEWEGSLVVQDIKHTAQFVLSLSDDHARRQADFRDLTSWADESIGLVILSVKAWPDDLNNIISNVHCIVVLRYPDQDVSAMMYAEKEKDQNSSGTRRGVLDAPADGRASLENLDVQRDQSRRAGKPKTSGCISEFGFCIDISLRVALSKDLDAFALLNASNLTCRRWEGTTWSSQYCSLHNVTVFVPSSGSESSDAEKYEHGYADVYCKCTRDGFYSVAREAVNIKKYNSTISYFVPTARLTLQLSLIFFWIWCAVVVSCALMSFLAFHMYNKYSTNFDKSKELFTWAQIMHNYEDYVLQDDWDKPEISKKKLVKNRTLPIFVKSEFVSVHASSDGSLNMHIQKSEQSMLSSRSKSLYSSGRVQKLADFFQMRSEENFLSPFTLPLATSATGMSSSSSRHISRVPSSSSVAKAPNVQGKEESQSKLALCRNFVKAYSAQNNAPQTNTFPAEIEVVERKKAVVEKLIVGSTEQNQPGLEHAVSVPFIIFPAEHCSYKEMFRMLRICVLLYTNLVVGRQAAKHA